MLKEGRKARVLAILCIAGMLAGCGNESGKTNGRAEESGGGVQGTAEDGAKGCFVESELVLPQEVTQIYAMAKLSDGRVEILAENREKEAGYLFLSEDGGESFATIETETGFQGGWVTGGAIAPDGTAVLGGYFNDVEDGTVFTIKNITPDGVITAVPLKLPQTQKGESTSNVACQMAFDSAGNLIVQDMNGDIIWVDRETGACGETLSCEEDISYFHVVGEKLLLMTTTGISIYRTTDREELSRDAVLDELISKDASFSYSGTMDSFPMVFGAGIDGAGLVYVNHAGIFFHNDGGSISEQLVTGERTSLSDTNMQFVSIVMAGETSILVQAADAGGDKLLRYEYDENASVLPEQELEVYVLEDSELLRSGILIYQKNHPEVYVNLTIGMTGEDGVTAEDAVAALNTEILAGNIPDVLILDGLPVDSYIEKGILADISGIVTHVEEQDGLFENVANVYRTEAGCYQMPARFYVNLVVGGEESVQAGRSLADFVEYTKKLKEADAGAHILKEQPARELLWTLYQADSANWFKDGALDEERIKEWLIYAESLYALDAYGDDAPGAHVYNGSLVATAATGAMGTLLKENKVGLGAAVNMLGMADILAINKETGGSYGLFASGETRCFVPYLQLGMSSDAGTAAEELLLTLLGKEAASRDSSGYPVNRAGWQEICTKSVEAYGTESEISAAVSDAEGTVVGWETNQLTDEACAVFTELLQSVDTPVPTDATIRSLILEEAECYVTGEVSLEDALAAIRQKVNLYLAE